MPQPCLARESLEACIAPRYQRIPRIHLKAALVLVGWVKTQHRHARADAVSDMAGRILCGHVGVRVAHSNLRGYAAFVGWVTTQHCHAHAGAVSDMAEGILHGDVGL